MKHKKEEKEVVEQEVELAPAAFDIQEEEAAAIVPVVPIGARDNAH